MKAGKLVLLLAVALMAGCTTGPSAPAAPLPAAVISTPPSTSATLPVPVIATATPLVPKERPGTVWVVASDTLAGYALRSFLQIPVGMTWGPDHKLYIADWSGHHVVRADKSGVIDDLPFWAAIKEFQDDGPRSVAFDSAGNLYVSNHGTIFRIEPDGSFVKLSGVQASPIGSIAISPTDELFYTDRAQENGALKRWSDGVSETIVADLPFAENMVFGKDGSLYLTQMAQGQLLKVDIATGTVSTFKEDVCGNDPCFLAVDGEGDIWVRGIATLRQFTPAGVEKKFVIDGQSYPNGPHGWHTAAGIAVDDEGGLWIASYNSYLLRLQPTTPGQPDPEFSMHVVSPGFEASSLAEGLNGEIFASDGNVAQIKRITPDGGVEVVLDHGFAGRTALAMSEEGVLYAGLPSGDIVRVESDGQTTHYARLLTCRMAFGADGALYAIVSDDGQSKSVVRITGVDTSSVVATSIAGVSLGAGESHISPALDDGFYVYIEQSCDLLFMDFNGQGRVIANIRPLGCGGPATMAASPLTGEIYLITHGPYTLYRFTADGQSTPIVEASSAIHGE